MDAMHISIAFVAAFLLRGATSSTVRLFPAATAISASSLLPEEVFQVTDQILRNLASEWRQQGGNSIFADVFSFGTTASASKFSTTRCKTYDGDSLWPSVSIWNAFNDVLGDALLEVPPIASKCYTNWNNYDVAACDAISDNFSNSKLHAEHPSSIMSPGYEGATCMPLEGALANCTIGGYPYYVVNATSVAQIQLAVNFARNLNLRLVVKNTGHDFAGKSSGAGAVSIWTHHFKSISYIPAYNGRKYSGKAFKIGAGVQAIELYAAAKKNDVTVVGGEGETVGISGGYIQGGGHSPLSGIYGLSADSALEFDVITADGRFITASEDTNADLFWALRGGGGSTFGVVAAVTVKAWPKISATTSSFTFSTSDTLSNGTFWAAVYSFWKNFPTFTNAGTYGYFRIWPLGDGILFFEMTPFFAPNMTVAETEALVKPWTDEMTCLGIDVAIEYKYYDNFYDAWYPSFPIESVGGAQGRFASRLFQRENWANDTIMNETFAVVQSTAESGYYFTGFSMKNHLHPENTANSANPAWRNSLSHTLTSYSWMGQYPSAVEQKEAWKAFNNTIMAKQRAITPGSGSYLGEADISEPNFQQSFWGSNYDRLLSIKRKHDPYQLFYATTGVGSEFWRVETADELPTQNGKLCRAS